MSEDERPPFCERHEWVSRPDWSEDGETQVRTVDSCLRCGWVKTPDKVGEPK